MYDSSLESDLEKDDERFIDYREISYIDLVADACIDSERLESDSEEDSDEEIFINGRESQDVLQSSEAKITDTIFYAESMCIERKNVRVHSHKLTRPSLTTKSTINEKMFKNCTMHGCHFDLPEYYELSEIISSSWYGIMANVIDLHNNSKISLLRLSEHFTDPIQIQIVHRNFLKLKSIKHENIVQLLDAYISNVTNRIYIGVEYMEYPLRALITQNLIQPGFINSEQFSMIMKQLIFGVDYLHQCAIIHANLKPDNILINSNFQLKIANFGYGVLNFNEREIMNVYKDITYRAPEMIFNETYDQKGSYF
uniref:Protein kinase domain-containing protein n=1 Tax=Acrobeloides nanus TaxID=290746 RepID=A0A914CV74_9BILA